MASTPVSTAVGGSSRNRWDEVSVAPFISLGSHDATGGTVGGQIGYRWQAAQWVFGVEAQGNWADFHGSNAIRALAAISNDTRIDAFGTFTGQVGYAWNNVLFYVKGGAAVTSNRYREFLTGTGVLVTATVDDTRWGGVVGAGLEYGFAPNWSAGIEYNHMFMQDRTYNFASTGVVLVGRHPVRHQPRPPGRRCRYCAASITSSAVRPSRVTDRT